VKPETFDKVIHERVRLAIMSALAARGKMTFPELKELLEVTDGNLSVHASVLEKHGLVAIEKDFHDRRPRTTLRLTRAGRQRFQHYLAQLEQLIKESG
jgi:DNA-binding MarR family transcriptional regulator